MTYRERMANPIKRSVTVRISEFSHDALAGLRDETAEDVPARFLHAVRVYLGDRGAGHPGWPYPTSFGQRPIREIELELSIDEDQWHELEEEALRQGVSVSRLATHAALYYVAEVDSGRIAQRILDDVDEKGKASRG